MKPEREKNTAREKKAFDKIKQPKLIEALYRMNVNEKYIMNLLVYGCVPISGYIGICALHFMYSGAAG